LSRGTFHSTAELFDHVTLMNFPYKNRKLQITGKYHLIGGVMERFEQQSTFLHTYEVLKTRCPISSIYSNIQITQKTVPSDTNLHAIQLEKKLALSTSVKCGA
jgi:hypothetical protein